MRGSPRIRSAAQLTAAQLAFVASGYVLTLVLSRVLGTGSFGVYNVVLTLLTAANLVQTQGVPQALSHAVATDPAQTPALWLAAVRIQRATSLAAALLLAATAPLWALADRRLLVGLLVAAAAVPGYAAFAALGGLLNGEHRFGAQAAMLATYSGLRVAAVLALGLTLGLYGAIAAFAVTPLVVAGLFRARRPRLPPGAAPAPWRPLARFAAAAVGFSAAIVGILSVDLLLVKALVPGRDAAGVYAAAQNLSRVPYFLLLPAGAVLFPTMADVLRTGDRASIRALVDRGVEGALTVVLPCVCIVTAARRPVLELVVGPAYAGAARPLALLGPALGLLAVAFTLGSIVAGSGRPRAAMTVAAAALALQVALGSVLTARHGLRGAALSTLIAAGVCAGGQALLVRRLTGALAAPTRVARIGVAGSASYAVASLAGSRTAVVPIAIAAAAADVALLAALRVLPRGLLARR